MIRTLDEAVRAGEPRIDIVVQFKDGVNYSSGTDVANAIGPDIELYVADWHGSPKLRIGQVTAEGALRHFGVKIRRVPLEKWDHDARQYVGVHSDAFRWDEVEIRQWPAALAPYIFGISMTQPGSNDDLQLYVPQFDR